jgi:hypothetical protein
MQTIKPSLAERRADRQRQYAAVPENRQKIRARYRVTVAIRSGKLVREPCEKCGALKSHAHHHDYSKPLEVQWLCSPCHGKEHRPSHCKRGHPLTDDNVRTQRTRTTRTCIQCHRDWTREYWKIHKRSEWRRI